MICQHAPAPFRVFVISIVLLLTTQTFALDLSQVLSQVPEGQNPYSLEPGVIGKGISTSPTPYMGQPTSALTTPRPPKPSPSSFAASKISFVFNKVKFDGNHVFSTHELETIFLPYLHHKITLAQLQSLVQAVTEKYQNAGYFLSSALLPPQSITNGVVLVRVVEGFVSKVEVQGLSNNRLIRFIEKYGDSIKTVKPIKYAELERYLLLLNDIPGFTVKSVFAPDPNTPLGSKLTLITTNTAIQATATQDNYQTPYLGPEETGLSASLNSVITSGGTLYARALAADSEYRKLNYYELRYSQTLNTNGLSFSIDGYSTKTNPQFILTPLKVTGLSNDINVTLSYPILLSRARSFSIVGEFEYMDNSSTILTFPLYTDEFQDVSLAGQYNDIFWKGQDSVILTFDQGLTNFKNKDFHSRVGAAGNFLRIMATASREQNLNDRFSLYALITTQYSNKILPGAEEFTFGGPYLGRGYDWQQFTGDEGVAGKAEFRINTNPDMKFLKQAQYYIFYDAGQLWNLIPQIPTTSGTSTGLGFRALLMPHLNAEAFLGKPLTTPNASQVIMRHSGHAFLGFFQLVAYI